MDINLLSLLIKRRSIRKYKNKKVEQEKIDKMIQAAFRMVLRQWHQFQPKRPEGMLLQYW